MTPDCVSSLAIDRWLAGELREDELRRVEAHLASCAECRARREHAARFKAQVVAELAPFPELPTPARTAPRWRPRGRARAALGGLLAVAAALLLFLRQGTRESAHDGGLVTRTKGGGRLGFFVKRGGAVERGAPGQALRPGDAVEFSYSAPKDGYLAVLSVDGAGRASVYYPSAPRALPFAAGERPLDASTVLDGVLGHERWFALFCESAVELEPIRARLESHPTQPLAVAGCSVDPMAVAKEAR
ncbi:MAG TPA: zf-HC2 domain-containing protein [Polyangiaceae bacterium]|nr:zf-HC2 domain-containing protein [Polyangiaceae bacterium]